MDSQSVAFSRVFLGVLSGPCLVGGVVFCAVIVVVGRIVSRGFASRLVRAVVRAVTEIVRTGGSQGADLGGRQAQVG